MKDWKYLVMMVLAPCLFGGLTYVLAGPEWGVGVGCAVFALFVFTPPPGDYP